MTGVLTRRNLVTKRHTRGTCVQREGHVKGSKGAAVSRPRRGLRRNQTCPAPSSWTSSLQNGEKINLLLKLLSLWHFVTAALAN